VPVPSWPAGVTTRVFDGSEAMLRDWTDAYNESFAEHWGFIPGDVEEARRIAADPLFLEGGVIVAYRDGRPAGFCRNDAVGTTGVVGVLGTSPHARGIGLGRALLRWGIGHLERAGFEKVALVVDGENETAQRLYRSEGFGIERTRRIWSRPL
jgi:mycothiol synthase